MQTHLALERRPSWPVWAKTLRRLGLEDLAIWALEAGAPLALLSAQVLYLGGPLLRPLLSEARLADLAALLENGEEQRAFISFLREETAS
ncbi:MAG: hypothetical protein ABWK53_02890 [Anaerolineales bacterium]